jgi:hypothetical protein
MDKTTNSNTTSSKLALKKETLQHLKVRTDLKGGIALAAVACCTKTHHCAAALDFGAVINPIAR